MASAVQAVRDSTAFVVSRAEHVHINASAIGGVVDGVIAAKEASTFPLAAKWDHEYHFYDGTALTAQYVLVLDAMNFCFWPAESEDWEYDRFASAVRDVASEDGGVGLSAPALCALTEETLTEWFAGEAPPGVSERVRLLREVGQVLVTHWDGSVEKLIEAAGGSAAALVDLITMYFPGFRDASVYKGHQVFYYKRAQIVVGDIWGAFSGEGLGSFDDIHRLTMFADYRVPQLLRPMGVLEYSEALEAAVDAQEEITPGSEWECEIRAATVQAVEMILEALKERAPEVGWCSIQLDWYLWGEGEKQRTTLPPHHRVRTIFY